MLQHSAGWRAFQILNVLELDTYKINIQNLYALDKNKMAEVAQWLSRWTTDWKVVSLNPRSAKLPLLGL